MPRPIIEPDSDDSDLAARVVASLVEHGLRIAVAESLTGGLVVAALTSVPGASQVVNGGIVAYATAVKGSLVGVDPALLARAGAVHPEVARQMAVGVRTAIAVDDRPADVGLATTGVAGPDWQDGQPPGTVFVGIAVGDEVDSLALELSGDRQAIRTETVRRALGALLARLDDSGTGGD